MNVLQQYSVIIDNRGTYGNGGNYFTRGQANKIVYYIIIFSTGFFFRYG